MSLSVITDNLLYFMVGPWPHGPLGGAALTVILSLTSAVLAGVLGLALGIALSLARGWALAILRLFIGFFRAIPVLMLIFWMYFLGPLAFGLDIPGTASVVAALSLIGGAYLAHSVHAGIAALPAGQWQAAAALGLGRARTMRLVILPQALPPMIPSFVNQLVALTKDSSLAYVIGVGELSFVATQISNRVIVHPFEVYAFAALVYFLLCSGLELGGSRLAHHYRNKFA